MKRVLGSLGLLGCWGLLSLLGLVAVCGAAELRWDPSTGQVDGYRVFYWETDAPEAEWSKDVGAATSVNLDLLYLDLGKSYTFEVRAYNAAGHSGPSNQVEYVRMDLTVPPEKTAFGQAAEAPAGVNLGE